jgi:hypothetical protein
MGGAPLATHPPCLVGMLEQPRWQGLPRDHTAVGDAVADKPWILSAPLSPEGPMEREGLP